ncbi:galactose oxidase [Meredithblackwellia eburnea MCA 4105]
MGKLKKQKKAKPSADGTPVLTGKAAAKKAKQAKQASKKDAKELKVAKKSKGKDKAAVDDMDADDLIRTLAEFREKWAEEHKVTEDVVDGPPSRRANATLTACPVKDHLYLFGGEYFDGQTVQIYPDLYRYEPSKNEWRRFTSPTAPGPRSAHAMVSSAASGGRLWCFGGEFSSPNQSTFHHYRDLWCFSIETHSWERFDTKLRPSARSGHRMAMFKHYIFLFGGFQDTGIRTSYLADLWVFDTLEYKWQQIELSDFMQKPGARSGFSFLPCPDGIILHGGYTKTYEGKRVTGMALSDTWLLRIPPVGESGEIDFKTLKWEKRKKVGYAPTPRSGCTMALWSAKNMGILFGGVSDDDKDEETLESTFYNELFGYNMASTGRWVSLPLKKKKKAGGKKRKPKPAATPAPKADENGDVEDEEMDDGEKDDVEGDGDREDKPWEAAQRAKEDVAMREDEDDPDDPEKSVPFARYNTMLAVQRSTLYIYGGILETDSKEYTLDDFFTLQLDKLDRYNCLKECRIESVEWHGSDSENDDYDSDSDDSDEDGSESGSEDGDSVEDGAAPNTEDTPMPEVEMVENLKLMSDAEIAAAKAAKEHAAKEDLRKRATAFMGVSKATDRTEEDVLSTPQPGENLAKFYARTKDFWAQKAFASVGAANRGKDLRRDGFQLAEEAYQEYLPLLEEIVRIQEQAGLDADEMSKGGRAGGLGAESRNRR